MVASYPKEKPLNTFFRNRLYLEKREACTYHLRKNTYVKICMKITISNYLAVTSGEKRRGEGIRKNTQKAPTMYMVHFGVFF